MTTTEAVALLSSALRRRKHTGPILISREHAQLICERITELNTESDIYNVLKRYVAEAGSQVQAAARLGISPQYLSDILNGGRALCSNVAQRLGYEQVVFYKKIVGRAVRCVGFPKVGSCKAILADDWLDVWCEECQKKRAHAFVADLTVNGWPLLAGGFHHSPPQESGE